MLAVNVLQRGVGLVRGLGFCHFLSDGELGQWALINSFFLIAVPIAVFGLPGSFGRFVEHYRGRAELGPYLRRVTLVSALGLAALSGWMLAWPNQFQSWVFGGSSPYSLTLWCVLTLLSVAVFSFCTELLSALREIRVVSLMQFIQSLLFAGLGLGLLSYYGSWTVLLPSFSLASAVAVLPAVMVLWCKYCGELHVSTEMQPRTFWTRIAPFAMAVWVINLLSNLFEVGDRYMLLHLSSGGEAMAQAAVGQYHCGRILPNLLVSLGMMLGGILLPYLSADWERRKSTQVAARLRQVLQGVSVSFMVLSVAAMCFAPLLFQVGFAGRYAAAERILPLALLQAIWASLFLIAQSYMLCIERGKQLAVLLLFSLLVNLGLNWWLIGQFGLLGAVIATASASLIGLWLLYWRLARSGCPLGSGVWLLSLLPVAVAAGPIAAASAIVLAVLVAGRTEWLLSASDRAGWDAALLPPLHRCKLPLRSLWPG